VCEDALTGGVAGGTENTEGARPPHPPWAGPWRGPRNAAMGLQGLDQLLELRWKDEERERDGEPICRETEALGAYLLWPGGVSHPH